MSTAITWSCAIFVNQKTYHKLIVVINYINYTSELKQPNLTLGMTIKTP